jgi:hypothetical protein
VDRRRNELGVEELLELTDQRAEYGLVGSESELQGLGVFGVLEDFAGDEDVSQLVRFETDPVVFVAVLEQRLTHLAGIHLLKGLHSTKQVIAVEIKRPLARETAGADCQIALVFAAVGGFLDILDSEDGRVAVGLEFDWFKASCHRLCHWLDRGFNAKRFL